MRDSSKDAGVLKRTGAHLASLTFVSKAASILQLRPPCVGKTRLAVALGLRAIK